MESQVLSKKSIAIRFGIFFVLAGLAAFAMWSFIQKNTYKSQAEQEKINISLNPKASPKNGFKINTEHTINVVLQGSDLSKKISGFTLEFKTGGNVKIVSIGSPDSIPTSDPSIFTNIVNESTKISYVISQADDKLPAVVTIPLKIKAETVGVGTLQVDILQSEVVGNVPGSSYALATVDPGTYIFSLGSYPVKSIRF